MWIYRPGPIFLLIFVIKHKTEYSSISSTPTQYQLGVRCHITWCYVYLEIFFVYYWEVNSDNYSTAGKLITLRNTHYINDVMQTTFNRYRAYRKKNGEIKSFVKREEQVK